MDNNGYNRVTLDPDNLNRTMEELALAYDLDDETLAALRRVIALFPRPVQMYVDEANALLYENLSLVDKFTFDLESDDLVLFSLAPENILDAAVEMLMYLVGFSTMLGNEEEWVTEFAIGAWRPIKNRIKRQLGIAVKTQPRLMIGLPPDPDQVSGDDPYPFRTLVSAYDLGSFYQMIVLAGRDDIAVSFPSETHSKVLAVYVYCRRAMQEISQGVGLYDHEMFNTRLVEAIQRLQTLFNPASLPPPGWLRQTGSTLPLERTARQPDRSDSVRTESDSANPFESFIAGLFRDDEADEDDEELTP